MKPVLIKDIEQKSNHIFCITWSDGIQNDYRLSQLQKICPCAHCTDENTGERKTNPDKVPPDLRAISIRNVGRYALKIQFSSGCSTGIYTFDLLRSKKGLV